MGFGSGEAGAIELKLETNNPLKAESSSDYLIDRILPWLQMTLAGLRLRGWGSRNKLGQLGFQFRCLYPGDSTIQAVRRVGGQTKS